MPVMLRTLAVLFVTVANLNSLTFAHTPVDFLEVVTVKPSLPIEHAVDVKGKFDQQRIETMLQGPRHFSRAVGCLNRPVKKTLACLSWFKIAQPQDETRREVTVLDMVRGSQNKRLTIGTAEYLLLPTQLIASGAPDPIPEGLDYYKAYRIVDAPSLDRKLTLTESIGPENRTLGKPLFLCLAVQQWHHEEYVPASHPNDCFVVYELDPQEKAGTFSTIDPFGLNELQAMKSQWLCVRAALLGTKAE